KYPAVKEDHRSLGGDEVDTAGIVIVRWPTWHAGQQIGDVEAESGESKQCINDKYGAQDPFLHHDRHPTSTRSWHVLSVSTGVHTDVPMLRLPIEDTVWQRLVSPPLRCMQGSRRPN